MDPLDALDAITAIENARPCLDADTTDADLAFWCRDTIIPILVNYGLI